MQELINKSKELFQLFSEGKEIPMFKFIELQAAISRAEAHEKMEKLQLEQKIIEAKQEGLEIGREIMKDAFNTVKS